MKDDLEPLGFPEAADVILLIPGRRRRGGGGKDRGCGGRDFEDRDFEGQDFGGQDFGSQDFGDQSFEDRASGGADFDADAERLSETKSLIAALGGRVVAVRRTNPARFDPAFLFGDGVVAEIAERVKRQAVGLAVVDADLNAVQRRNLERRWSCRVVDRAGVILEIFRRRARSREGRIQVELAALNYRKSRLTRSWTHLERQRGGAGTVSGPGEKQIESDRRMIDRRLLRLKRDLDAVRRTRSLHRRRRRRRRLPVCVLAGYANAGKSTFFNRLCHAGVLVADAAFATLDPTLRRVALPDGGAILVSDAVGFVADMPPELIAAFKATLEEIALADLILHVCDVSHPGDRRRRREVRSILASLLAKSDDPPPVVEIWNKIDGLKEADRRRLQRAADALTGENDDDDAAARSAMPQRAWPVSALRGDGVAACLRGVAATLDPPRTRLELKIDAGAGEALSWLHRRGRVTSQRVCGAQMAVTVELDEVSLAQFRRLAKAPNASQSRT